MRIAHVITRLILGGAQENTLLTCEDLIHRHGDDVLLITGPALGPEGSLIERARAGGVPLCLIGSLRRSIHPWRDARCYHELKRAIQRFRPEVVHTHSAKGGWLGRRAAWTLGVPAVAHTVHGAPFHPFQPWYARKFFQACERHAARRCHVLISVAEAMTDLMVNAAVAPRDRFQTIYSGMEVEPFLHADQHRQAMRERLGFTSEQVVIGKVARFFRLKGHDDLISAARRVLDRVPQARFLLVGDGILRSACERRIEQEGLAPFFRFTGLVPPDEVPAYLGAMDIVVHTSLREGLARVLPQALLARKPVVSYDIDGAREVVISGETGYLIPPRDVPGLANALIHLTSQPKMREAYGSRGQQLCLPRFRHESMTEQIREVYVRLLSMTDK